MLLDEMRIFYYVVQQQSFSKAAKRLGVSKSHVSKMITKLEEDIQNRLISRSTRKLLLTDAGESFYQYCAKVVATGEQGYALMNELNAKASGVLKVSIPPALAFNALNHIFAQFLADYPDIILDIQLETQIVDLIKDGYDLALRSAVLESSNLIAQRVYRFKQVICATEKYFNHKGMPKTPQDLVKHNFAIYGDAKLSTSITLKKQKKQQVEEIVIVKGNFISNQLDLIKKFMLEDACMCILPEFMLINELKDQVVVKCLEDYTSPSNNLYAIYPEREFMLPKVSLFLQRLKQHFDQLQH
ncbi:LysR family transcriptional regulator [Thiotrichales bacterium 19X7-9]|nr:LysR family transcriptional regulator [Thiotrichales bacterium 19X7-9]